MSDYTAALSAWKSASPIVAKLTSDFFTRQGFESACLTEDSASWLLRGSQYSIEILLRPISLSSANLIATQSTLTVHSALALWLEKELRIADCSPLGQRYSIGTLKVYIEWVFSNYLQTPIFSPTRWSLLPPVEESSQWVAKLLSCDALFEAVRRGEPMFPLCKAMVEGPINIGGSPPVWGGEFEKAVCMLDSFSPTAVAEHIESHLKSRTQDAYSLILRCQLDKLSSWLLSTAR